VSHDLALTDAVAQVAPGYVHVAKLIRPLPRIQLGNTVLKWYDIAPADTPVPAEIRDLARDELRAASVAGRLALGGGMGFAILHRCREGFYFLIVSTWWNDNEVWSTVWAKDGDDDPGFSPWPTAGSHRPTFCVWELGAVWHEQQAWSRYLRSSRDLAARQLYLEDVCDGAV
jgi:hypothetical protein